MSPPRLETPSDGATYGAMTAALPDILSATLPAAFPLDSEEVALLRQARALYDGTFYGHALLDLWNAAVHNLRRRVERYGTDLFVQVVKDEPGRKKYQQDGESLSERWSGVEDVVVVHGAERLGLVSKKGAKVLETINWLRNHTGAAHAAGDVSAQDVIALALMLETGLFSDPLPDPGHSVAALFAPTKQAINADALAVLGEQILGLRPQELRVCFGFLLDLLCKGEQPALDNASFLLPIVWNKIGDDLRKVAGMRCHTFTVDPSADESTDKGARTRVFEFLVRVDGVSYIPDATRAPYFRRAAQLLAKAKDTGYGWKDEEAAARTLLQLGTVVPSIAFAEVYDEVLAVWFGNYWGRSEAHLILAPFVESLGTDKLRMLVEMIVHSPRVREELAQSKPSNRARELLAGIRAKLVLAAHIAEVDAAATTF